MQTNSYIDWMRRPLSSAVCPTPDIWPDAPADTARRRGAVRARRSDRRVARFPHDALGHPGEDTVLARNSLVDIAERPVASKEDFMNEEKLRILKMLEEGKVSAEEAARLMEALDKTESRPKERDLKRKWLHIRVQEHGRDTVNMKIPLALLKFGFKLAPQATRHHAERARRHAEQARARAGREREKAVRRAERAADRMRRKLAGKLGDHPELDVDEIVNTAVRESLAEMEEGIEESLEEAGEALEEHARNGFGMLAGKDFDLDLDSILKMAQSEGFDGKIIDVYDEDGDEHVTIDLE